MTERTTQRLFIAVDPPPEFAGELAAWARAQQPAARGMRVIPAANIHLTLAFLGEQPAADRAAIVRAMAAAARTGAAGELEIGEPVLLPPRRPRALAAAVFDRSGALSELRAHLAGELAEEIGWGEVRAFRPHLTLARLGRDAYAPTELTPLPQARFRPRELVLYRSHLEQSGARYEAVERVALN